MSFVAIYDACVLYPNYLRDLLIRIARTDLVQAKWSEEILDEAFRSISKNRPDLEPAKLARTRRLICEAVEDCLITNYEALAKSIALPDPHDRHVLAAAIKAGAQVIVTANLSDFPEALLLPYNLVAVEPDEFILNQIDLKPLLIAQIITEALEDYAKPRLTLEDLLAIYERSGLARSTQRLRKLMQAR